MGLIKAGKVKNNVHQHLISWPVFIVYWAFRQNQQQQKLHI